MCRASLAWKPFPLCLCTQDITAHTGRAFRWVLSSSYWFHGTLACLLHQLRAHQLCTTGFRVDWLPERVLVLIWFAFLPHSPQTASPVQGRLEQRPAASWNVGPRGPLVIEKQQRQSLGDCFFFNFVIIAWLKQNNSPWKSRNNRISLLFFLIEHLIWIFKMCFLHFSVKMFSWENNILTEGLHMIFLFSDSEPAKGTVAAKTLQEKK